MTDDELKAAKRSGYSKGYAAGKHRKQREISLERARREKQAFLDRVFIELLPFALQAEGWTSGGKPVTTSVDRVNLARNWTIEALSKRPVA